MEAWNVLNVSAGWRRSGAVRQQRPVSQENQSCPAKKVRYVRYKLMKTGRSQFAVLMKALVFFLFILLVVFNISLSIEFFRVGTFQQESQCCEQRGRLEQRVGGGAGFNTTLGGGVGFWSPEQVRHVIEERYLLAKARFDP